MNYHIKDIEDLKQLTRLYFIVNNRRATYCATFNNFYLQDFIKYYKKLANFKNYFLNKYNIPKDKSFQIDLENEQIITINKEQLYD